MVVADAALAFHQGPTARANSGNDLLRQPTVEVSPNLETLFAQMVALLRLPPNWNSYGAAPICPSAVRGALELLTKVNWTGPNPTVSPRSTGGVTLEWAQGDDSVEIAFDSRGREMEVLVDAVDVYIEVTARALDDYRIMQALVIAAQIS